MRTTLLAVFALLLSTATAFAGDKPTPAKGAGKPPAESVEDVMEQAASAGNRPEETTPPPKAEEKKPEEKKPAAAKTPAPPHAAQPAQPQQPGPPPTDDNDASAEAAAPTALVAVQQTGETRRRGPYELGKLDCRILDGAGIERLLPSKIVAGEEPDILCRIVVTQPANVATLPHTLTLTVTVGANETFRQVRKVRISSVGRRAMVFVVPSDKISSDDPAQVKLHALLSSPASPGGGQDAKFEIFQED